ncbi:porin family protein [Tenacibaculum adriaticum]|uniref:porin family protein n=1 Tax=Tenacibaculum adriaticum TaxID=413713 RepID=UPI001FE28B66|nr:porin family protein [Tenacibaculum adriaticum]
MISFSQKDSLQLGDSYWEDQLYLNITYNILDKQPTGFGNGGFSYGFSAGYIKDIPFNRRGNFSTGIGIGYNYDSFSHNLTPNNVDFTSNPDAISSQIGLHNLEFPIQIRWRTSDAVTYSFWRIYTGVKLSYNLSNNFTYTIDNEKFSFTNIDKYNNFQTGLELSVGYGAFNLYVYYGLTPMYKDAYIDNEKIDTTITKFGLIFFLL